MATVYLIVALVIAILAVIFALQNTMTITIAFLAWQLPDKPLSLVLLVTLAIGVLIGLLVLSPSAIKSSISASSQRKRVGSLEKELDEHKARVAELTKPKPETPPSLPPSDASSETPEPEQLQE